MYDGQSLHSVISVGATLPTPCSTSNWRRRLSVTLFVPSHEMTPNTRKATLILSSVLNRPASEFRDCSGITHTLASVNKQSCSNESDATRYLLAGTLQGLQRHLTALCCAGGVRVRQLSPAESGMRVYPRRCTYF